MKSKAPKPACRATQGPASPAQQAWRRSWRRQGAAGLLKWNSSSVGEMGLKYEFIT